MYELYKIISKIRNLVLPRTSRFLKVILDCTKCGMNINSILIHLKLGATDRPRPVASR